MTTTVQMTQQPRFGLHYFPDTLHYREADLQTWLPKIQEFGATWLVLRSEVGRAIPEHFLRGIHAAGIEPLVQFSLPLECLPDPTELHMLLDVYARWGVQYLVFHDQPNDRTAWPATNWVQQDLVERFLDRFLPTASAALEYGLTPVFPPLRPGGSYWDTAFLRSALEALLRRKQDALLQNMPLAAYAWTNDHALNWGAGGPERWPKARAYFTPPHCEDQRGFRIFDWYQTIAQSVLQRTCPIILLQAGQSGPDMNAQPASPADCESIARLLAGKLVSDPLDASNIFEPIPESVIACNFWLLSAEVNTPEAGQAWLADDDTRRPVAAAIRAWQRERAILNAKHALANAQRPGNPHSIQHYLLLPGYEWGVSDWYLEIIRPFVKKYRPTIGFSLDEAEKSARVTVVGNSQSYPEDFILRLEKAGCLVEQIAGDGTHIATQLAER